MTSLRPNRHQPRTAFSDEQVRELSESICEKGVLQPILVRPVKGEAGSFEIVAGERRWRAAKLAKLRDVPVVVREMSDAESLEIAIIENVQRADLNAIEEATAYQQLKDQFGYTQERIAREVGKSPSHVANTLRLLRLPEEVKNLIRERRLSAGHARALVGSSNPLAEAKKILAFEMTVRQAEGLSQREKTPRAIFKLRDGRSIRNVTWREIDHIMAENEMENRVLRAVRQRFAAVPKGEMSIGELLSDSHLIELVHRARKRSRNSA